MKGWGGSSICLFSREKSGRIVVEYGRPARMHLAGL